MTETIEWHRPSDKMPMRLVPVLVVGVLDGEHYSATHEGLLDPDNRWKSVRRDMGNGDRLKIDDVKKWAEMPTGQTES